MNAIRIDPLAALEMEAPDHAEYVVRYPSRQNPNMVVTEYHFRYQSKPLITIRPISQTRLSI